MYPDKSRVFASKVIVLLSLLLVFITPQSLQAAAFTVSNNGETRDVLPGNSICADAAGNCTLRAAIDEANALAGDDMIRFSLQTPAAINLTLGQLNITSNLIIEGPEAGNLTIQRDAAAGTPDFGIFNIAAASAAPANVSLSRIIIANGNALNASGGGISLAPQNTLNLSEVTIRNSTARSGGGIYNFGGTLNIARSTINNNSAVQNGGITNQGVTTIISSTISGNTATAISGVQGNSGGIGNSNSLTLINVTISYNSASDFGGGVLNTVGATTVIRNSIVANNVATSGPDVIGPFNSLGNNLIGRNSNNPNFPAGNPNVNNDRVGTIAAPLDPLLGLLQDNGGLTATRSLLAGSVAIDAGNNCVFRLTCPTNNLPMPLVTDQRGAGFSRLRNTVVDIGAFEVQTGLRPSTVFDFDGDGKSDISVFRPSSGIWYRLNSGSNNSFFSAQFGAPDDKIAPADFDGDGKTDLAVFRSSSGTWYLQQSTLGFAISQFGASEDKPVPADFDADGKADLAVFRPSNGTWYVQRSTTGFYSVQFGQAGDVPQTGDFDADGKADISLFRPSNGTWYRLNSSDNSFVATQFGATGDVPNSADFDGDGKTDLAVFRPSTGVWFIQQSAAGFVATQFGQAGDRPVAADYDGDGKADIAVWRVASGTWFINQTTAGLTAIQFGANGDVPAESAFGQP